MKNTSKGHQIRQLSKQRCTQAMQYPTMLRPNSHFKSSTAEAQCGINRSLMRRITVGLAMRFFRFLWSRRTRLARHDAKRLKAIYGSRCFSEALNRAQGKAWNEYRSVEHWLRVAAILNASGTAQSSGNKKNSAEAMQALPEHQSIRNNESAALSIAVRHSPWRSTFLHIEEGADPVEQMPVRGHA